MKMHLFDVELAEKYGVHAAIILNHIVYWVNYNRNNNTNFHDDNWWVYHSIKAFNKLFPYMSEKIIRRNLKKLESSGLIITGNYNNKQYDRTKWYAIDLTQCDQTSTSIYPKGTIACAQKVQMEISQTEKSIYPKGTNGFTQTVQMDLPKKGTPIPNNKTNNKTNIESNNKTNKEKEILVSDKSKTNIKNIKNIKNDSLEIYEYYKHNIKSGERKRCLDKLSKILIKHKKEDLIASIDNYIKSKDGEHNLRFYRASGNFFNSEDGFFFDYLPSEYFTSKRSLKNDNKYRNMFKRIKELEIEYLATSEMFCYDLCCDVIREYKYPDPSEILGRYEWFEGNESFKSGKSGNGTFKLFDIDESVLNL